MLYDQLLIPARKTPWIKVTAIGTGIAGARGGAVYLVTLRAASINHQLELAQKNMAILDAQKELIKEK